MPLNENTTTDEREMNGNKSILNVYEEKLSYTKRQLVWKTWLEARPLVSSESKIDGLTISPQNSQEAKIPPKEIKIEIGNAKFRDIRCCKCSCVGNIHVLERTEEIIDLLRNCCYVCSANLLQSLPYMKKKKHHSALDQNFNFETEGFVVKKCSGEAEATNTPSYHRNRFYSQTEALAYHNQKPIQKPSGHKSLLSSQATAESDNTAPTSPSQGSLPAFKDNLDLPAPNQPTNSEKVSNDTANESQSFEIVDKRAEVFKKKALDVPSQLVYSYHRSLLAAGKMRQHAGKKPVRVHLLNGESILLVFEPKVTVREVFEQVCTMHAVKESHFFGLSAIVENEHRFMDLKQKLSKYAPKEWGKEIRRRGSDLSIQPSSIFTVQFQVQYYVEHPKLICDEESRFQYYLQLKKNVLQSKVPVQDELLFTLAATALHLDMGPFDPATHKAHYFDPHDYVPGWFLKKWNEDYLWLHLPTMHEELIPTSSFQAQADYIKQASNIEDVPVHYYRLFKTKRETIPSVVIGIFHQGIRIHHVAQQGLDGPHLLDFEFQWNKVGRLFFAGKRFEIYPDDQPSSRKLVYYTGSKSRSKYLLRLLRDTHSLYMSLSPFVDHMRKIDGKNDRRKYRESYISGQNLEEKYIEDRERLIGGSTKQSVGNCVFTYQSSASNGSSRPESDVRHVVIEDEDDDAFVHEIELTTLTKPSSGSTTKNQEQLEAQTSNNFEVLENTKLALSHSTKENTASAKDINEPATVSGEDVIADVHRKGSISSDKILLGTHTMTSRTATLRKNSSIKKGLDSSSKDLESDSNSGSFQPSKQSMENTLASILHDSNLDPPSVNAMDSPHPFQDSIPKPNEQMIIASKLPVSDERTSEKKHKLHKTIVDATAVPRSDSNDSTMQKSHSKQSRSKKTNSKHRRNKSLHDANPSDVEESSGKHFGAPLTTKKSVEDLTAEIPPRNGFVGPKLDIAKALKERSNGQPQIGSAPATPYSTAHLDRGPIVAVSWHKANGLGTDASVPRRSRTNNNRENRRRSDITGLSTPEPTKNGCKMGTPGHTPGKPELLFQNRKNSRPVSYHVYPEVDMHSKSVNGLYQAVPENLHAPIYIENFKEVIV